jgi:hypothetical protein
MANSVRNLVKPRAAFILAAWVTSATSAHAQDPSRALMLTACVDAAGGTDLTAGKYAAAIAQINERRSTIADRGPRTHTHHCVAYVLCAT